MNQRKFAAMSAEKLNSSFAPAPAAVNFYSDPGLRAWAFAGKFLVSCIPLALIAVGVTWVFSLPWPVFVLLFGILSAVSYYDQIEIDDRQSPEWLERNRQNLTLQAHQIGVAGETQIAEMQTQIATLALENKRLAKRLLTQRAIGAENSTFVAANESEPSPWPDDFEPADVVAEIVQQAEDAAKPAVALELLIDFVAELYKHPDECLKSDGRTIDLQAGIVLPWSKRSGNPPAVCDQMKTAIGGMYPRLLLEEAGGRVWKLNIDAYADLESAMNKLTSV